MTERAADRIAKLANQLTSGTAIDATVSVSPTSAPSGVWAHVEMAPPDPILGLNEAFKADPSPNKLNLGVGAYRDDAGKPYVLNAVRKAEMRNTTNPAAEKEYLPISGLAEYCKLAAKLAFGDAAALAEGRVVTAQTLSGTGSLRVGAELLYKFYPNKTIYVCKPTWGNHNKIFPAGGLNVKQYRYYDPSTRGLDFDGMIKDLNSAEDGAIVLLHACAHNPTGVDPTQEQWKSVLEVCKRKRFLCFFDSAYQGFASGDLDKDAFSLRLFLNAGVPMLLAQSFAKNMGLYGERAGALHAVCASPDEAKRVMSQIKGVIRPMYSSPPRHGAAIALAILKDPALYAEWCEELKIMADRINDMRVELYNSLQAKGVPGDWNHILKQIGMFSYTGLNKQQVENLIKNWHVYLTADGRISMAGLNKRKCQYLAEAIADSVSKYQDLMWEYCNGRARALRAPAHSCDD
eukprot:TRINITY_DN16198_c1_g1_i1.p1 TRINITY_DN16198_c1_g1~~TRINITY_DN16198_c1_g1_i1.p1  ORF type:complete len:461 (+),score=65.19 TRINITY_DN16198_c1_g1_i1:153-1535(+)